MVQIPELELQTLLWVVTILPWGSGRISALDQCRWSLNSWVMCTSGFPLGQWTSLLWRGALPHKCYTIPWLPCLTLMPTLVYVCGGVSAIVSGLHASSDAFLRTAGSGWWSSLPWGFPWPRKPYPNSPLCCRLCPYWSWLLQWSELFWYISLNALQDIGLGRLLWLLSPVPTL